MISSRTLLYSCLMAIVLSYSGWYYVHLQHLNETDPPKQNQRDFIAKQVVYTLYNPEGVISRRYNSEEVKHYPKGNLTVFENPHVEIHENHATPWIIDANHGHAKTDDAKISLRENVRFSQTTPTVRTEIKAESLDFYRKKGIGYYRGNVRLQTGETLILADHAKTLNTPDNKLKIAIAYGTQQKPASYQTQLKSKEGSLVATADKLTYRANLHQVELKGHAVVIQGNHRFRAPLITYDIKQQRVISNQGFIAEEGQL